MKRVVGFAFAILVLVLPLPGVAAEPAWVEVRSPHFSVVTDAGEKRGREVALRFEQMRSVFGTLILRQAVNIPVPVQIAAFRNSKGMRQFLPLWKGKPIEAAGLFMGSEERNFILLDLSLEGRWETVFHEYTHMLMNANYPRTQLWFDEGFAEYYSTINITNKEVRIGEPPENVGYVLRQLKFAPVMDLFRIDHQSSVYNESDRKSYFYAQSWLLVHFLIDKQKLTETGKYFELVLNQKVPFDEAIRRAFGMEPKQLDRALEDYYRGNQVRVSINEAPPGLDSGGYQVLRLDPIDSKAILADVHLHSRDYHDQAVKELQEVLAAKPAHAGAHRGLGYAYMRKGQLDLAGEHFKRAAELDPNDARVLYNAAVFRSMSSNRDSEAVWEMKDQLAKAIAINPEIADAHALMALAHIWTQDVESAIASIKTAIRLSPRNERYQLNLGQFYIASQDWENAEALFRRLQQSTDPQISSSAADALQKIVAYRADPPAHLVRQVRPPDTSEYESPKWKRKKDAATPQSTAGGSASPTEEEAAPAAPDTRKIEYLRGRLLSVECDFGAKGATLSVASSGKTWKMRVRNRETLILINADEFSCSWTGQNVSLNYRAGGEADGDLVSLEIRTLTQEPIPLKKKQ